jgi:threonine aldolase
MLAFAMGAPVGDDVFDEDPTVHALQDRVAKFFHREAALFVPSGTMANQIAIRVHTQPGDELICEQTSHVYVWEAGGPAVLSGVTCRPIPTHDGILTVDDLRDKVRPNNEHYVRTRLLCLENTHNRAGGRVIPLSVMQAVTQWAHHEGLLVHLDGARLWNAIVATGISGPHWAECVDTLSVCFSKGLGAPVGSCLIGSREAISRARRVRKVLGGGMRQAGIIAAAALYALEHHVERLADDHRHAQMIAQALSDCPGIRLTPPTVETNLVWFEVDPDLGTARDVQEALRRENVLVISTGPQECRAVTHLDISAHDAARAAETMRRVLRGSVQIRGLGRDPIPGSD